MLRNLLPLLIVDVVVAACVAFVADVLVVVAVGAAAVAVDDISTTSADGTSSSSFSLPIIWDALFVDNNEEGEEANDDAE